MAAVVRTCWRRISTQTPGFSFRVELHNSRLSLQCRTVHKCSALCRADAVCSDPIPLPKPDGSPKEYSVKVKKIVDDVSTLTLMETADLNELLKATLNISDMPAMMPATSAQTQAPEEAKEEQTEFTVNLTKYADDSKIKVIKEVKNLVEGLNLVQAKKLVEGVPQAIKKDISKAEAEKLKSALEAVGGVVELV